MAIYLMDYENIKDFGGVERLGSNDRLIIFYSKNSTNVSLETIEKLLKNKVVVEMKNAGVGAKNALDFQLSSYLGYIIGNMRGTNETIYIVSKDKGYETLIDFWKSEKNITIRTIVNFRGDTVKAVVENKKNDIKKMLMASGIGLSQSELDKSINIINEFKTKTAINNNLNKLLKDSDKVGKMMKLIKKNVKDKK